MVTFYDVPLAARFKKEIAYLKLFLERMDNIEIIEEHPLTFHQGHLILLNDR